MFDIVGCPLLLEISLLSSEVPQPLVFLLLFLPSYPLPGPLPVVGTLLTLTSLPEAPIYSKGFNYHLYGNDLHIYTSISDFFSEVQAVLSSQLETSSLGSQAGKLSMTNRN